MLEHVSFICVCACLFLHMSWKMKILQCAKTKNRKNYKHFVALMQSELTSFAVKARIVILNKQKKIKNKIFCNIKYINICVCIISMQIWHLIKTNVNYTFIKIIVGRKSNGLLKNLKLWTMKIVKKC